jgi:hypothetical protein
MRPDDGYFLGSQPRNFHSSGRFFVLETTMREGIPTEYKHYRFRSRLEAMWARFFDLLGWEWKYEPFDYDGYIPDFVLLLPRGDVLVEVKPETDFPGLRQNTVKIDCCDWKKEALLLGVGLIHSHTEGFPHYLGLLGTFDVCRESRTWEPSTIHNCINHVGFQAADSGTYCRYQQEELRQCFKLTTNESFEEKWALSQNLVQWAPRSFGVKE